MTAGFLHDPAGPPPSEDYARSGDGASAALVSRAGSVDWLCRPRFDSPATFAALLGTPAQGRWRIAPLAAEPRVARAYRGDSLVLETRFLLPEGEVALTDFLVSRDSHASALVRLVEGRRGCVTLGFDCAPRFDYGARHPRTLPCAGGLCFDSGEDRLLLRGATEPAFSFPLAAGERRAFVLGPEGGVPDPEAALERTLADWADWAAPLAVPRGPYAEAARRSLVVLKGLIHAPTGAMVAAPTTSLPEAPGGPRNWDYRFCWLRDSALAVASLLRAGATAEAAAWREWLLRTVDDPAGMQIMYGLDGTRDLAESERPDLPGYTVAGFAPARPVRIGNAAHGQRQLDVWGELAETLDLARTAGLADPPGLWNLQRALTEQLAALWEQPDAGIWEVRGGARPFVHSKVMAWVALDRAIRSAERAGLPAPLARWRSLRAEIHAWVCTHGYSEARGSFVQSAGATALDAALLQIPLTGFLPPSDPRVQNTIAAIEAELMHDGLVWRYESADGLPPGEGAFLACSFWLAEARARQGRLREARALFESLLDLRNDVGLLAEEYDPRAGLTLGNFPQAFSHLALLDAARRLGT